MPFEFTPFTQLPEVVLVKPRAFTDERGWFAEWYKRSEFEAHGIRFDFPQDNESRSTRGVLRGLHFQNEPAAQGKLIRCVVGNGKVIGCGSGCCGRKPNRDRHGLTGVQIERPSAAADGERRRRRPYASSQCSRRTVLIGNRNRLVGVRSHIDISKIYRRWTNRDIDDGTGAHPCPTQ